KPLPGHEVQIRDEWGRVLGERCIGTIFIRGRSLMSAYYREPEATAQVLSDDGWLDTGDMGYIADGEVVITGRSKDL
ncbi:MAG: AMP-binding protein, partial [Gammaproteobacteria bacterium]|nr:AMP-binding protein [Gammaproteobacteria bacterium]